MPKTSRFEDTRSFVSFFMSHLFPFSIPDQNWAIKKENLLLFFFFRVFFLVVGIVGRLCAVQWVEWTWNIQEPKGNKKIFWNERTRQDRKLHPPTWWDVGFWWKRHFRTRPPMNGHTQDTHTRRNVLTASVCGYISGNLPQSTYRSFQRFFPPLASVSSWYHLVFFPISPFPLDFNRTQKSGCNLCCAVERKQGNEFQTPEQSTEKNPARLGK